jgi:hypothetical protein
MPTEMDRMNISSQYHSAFETEKWERAIQYISFPSDWTIQMIPPLGMAVVAFKVKMEGMRNAITIFLDGYSNRGAPFWGIIDNRGNLYERVPMEDTEELVAVISSVLKERKLHEREGRNRPMGEDIG